MSLFRCLFICFWTCHSIRSLWFATVRPATTLSLCETSHRNPPIFRSDIKKKVSSIRTPMLILGRLERTETNLMHFKWERNARKATLYVFLCGSVWIVTSKKKMFWRSTTTPSVWILCPAQQEKKTLENPGFVLQLEGAQTEQNNSFSLRLTGHYCELFMPLRLE